MSKRGGYNKAWKAISESSDDADVALVYCKAGQSSKDDYKKSDKRKKLNSNSESSNDSNNKEEVSSTRAKKTKKKYENDSLHPIETIILIAK